MDNVTHTPYKSLESFRPALIDTYLDTYSDDIIVQEKIHGSNIVIYGHKNDNKEWVFKLGSRKKWISMTDRFNNFQSIFKEHKNSIISLFNEIVSVYPNIKGIRLYGEIFGGSYGHQTDKGSFKTQTDPNYCPFNDFAFFDIYVDEDCVPVLKTHDFIRKHNLKIAPVIYQGPLITFLKDFDIEKFKSIVSKQFYNLDFIDTPKSTEGVTIRTTVDSPSSDESTILKYKQAWITENRRTNMKSPKVLSDENDITQECLDMLNINRLDTYRSKHTIDDMTNPRMLSNHMKNIIEDTIEDIQKEFPFNEYPELNIKQIKGKLSKKGYPMLKAYIDDMNKETLTPEKCVEIMENRTKNLAVQINMIRQRLNTIKNRIK